VPGCPQGRPLQFLLLVVDASWKGTKRGGEQQHNVLLGKEGRFNGEHIRREKGRGGGRERKWPPGNSSFAQEKRKRGGKKKKGEATALVGDAYNEKERKEKKRKKTTFPAGRIRRDLQQARKERERKRGGGGGVNRSEEVPGVRRLADLYAVVVGTEEKEKKRKGSQEMKVRQHFLSCE